MISVCQRYALWCADYPGLTLKLQYPSSCCIGPVLIVSNGLYLTADPSVYSPRACKYCVCACVCVLDQVQVSLHLSGLYEFYSHSESYGLCQSFSQQISDHCLLRLRQVETPLPMGARVYMHKSQWRWETNGTKEIRTDIKFDYTSICNGKSILEMTNL